MFYRFALAVVVMVAGTIVPRSVLAVSLADLWSDEAHFYAEPIEIAPEVDNMHFISMFWDNVPGDPHYKAYYIDAGYSTGLAKSYDGIHFTDLGTVLNTGASGAFDDRMAAFSSVMKDSSGVYHMVYEAAGYSGAYPGDVAYATSSDGRNFAKHGIILRHDTSAGSFERANNGTPSLHKQGDTWYLYYHGFDWNDCQVGLATGTDMMSLVRVSTSPIIPTSATGWDSGTVGKRSRPIRQGDYWYMAVEGSTDRPYATASWSTGVVRSSDLVHWEKCPLGNVIPQAHGGMNFDGPEMVKIGQDTYIYYRGPGNNTYRAKLVAGSESDARIRVAAGEITSGMKYVYELGPQAMADESRFNADVAEKSNIGLNPVGAADPVPYFYATSGQTEAYIEFRFDFSDTDVRPLRFSIRDTLALFRIIDSPQATTAVTEWSADGLTWNTIRTLQTPAWPGHATGSSSQGTREFALPGDLGLRDTLYYRVHFSGDVPFGWNWNQWNRASSSDENPFRVECDVVPADYVGLSSEPLLGNRWYSISAADEPKLTPLPLSVLFGNVAVSEADPDEPFEVMLRFHGPQAEVNDLVAELVARPPGSAYLSANDSDYRLEGTTCHVLLRFAPLAVNFALNWHFAEHPNVRLAGIRLAEPVPAPATFSLCAAGLATLALSRAARRRRPCCADRFPSRR